MNEEWNPGRAEIAVQRNKQDKQDNWATNRKVCSKNIHKKRRGEGTTSQAEKKLGHKANYSQN